MLSPRSTPGDAPVQKTAPHHAASRPTPRHAPTAAGRRTRHRPGGSLREGHGRKSKRGSFRSFDRLRFAAVAAVTRQPGDAGTETTMGNDRFYILRPSTITLHELTPRKSTVCTHAGGPRACFWPRVHITSCAHQISERAMNPLPSKYEWPSISGSKAASAGRNFANASEPLCTFA